MKVTSPAHLCILLGGFHARLTPEKEYVLPHYLYKYR